MKRRTGRLISLASALALVGALVPATVSLGLGEGITINELRIDQPSFDDDEFFELTGAGSASLDGLSYIVIGDSSAGSGVVESVTDLSGQSLGPDGFFVAAEGSFSLGTADLIASLNFENSDNVTHMLVDGFTGSSGDDLDTDDDGILDVTPWTSIVDAVALVESFGSGDQIYSAVTVGPDGPFVPGHAYDCEVGWLVGGFSLGSDETPGVANNCPPPPVSALISAVQGPGSSTPLNGQFVRVEGVVVGDFQGNDFAGDQLDGFFLQEEPADQDGDTNTSEGIFVFAPAKPVAVGDIVEVVGQAGEFFGKTQLNNVTSVTVTGNDPSQITSAAVSIPVTATSDWEKTEGMLVSFAQDLTISEFFNFDRFGQIALTSDRQFQGTHLASPGAAAVAIADANALDRILLDDGRTSSNPDPAIHPNGAEFTLSNTFRGGDVLQGVTGVIDYSFGSYVLQPTQGATYVPMNPRPTTPDPIEGDVRVASFNVLNFFTHLDDGSNDICGPTGNLECRGADSAEELTRQLDKLVAGIIALDADIVGIQEIENDIYPAGVDGSRAHDAVLTLVESLNAVEGAGTWAWVGEANYYNDYPVRNEIIYKPDSVVPKGDPVAYQDDAFDQVRGDDIEPVGRPPLAQTFRQNLTKGSNQPFTVVVNHFKSKGSDCDELGDFDLGDGQGNCNLTRVAQSLALLDFVDILEDTSSGVLVIGDLNSYRLEDPITALEDGGLTELVKLFEGVGAYSFVFDGQLGYLDTALATRSMLNKVSGLTTFHINADEPDILDYDTSFKKDAQDALYEALPYRVSDHDPVIVGLTFGGPK